MKKRILLTGGTGFVGSNFLYASMKAGWKVVSLAREKKGKTACARIESALGVIDNNFKKKTLDVLEGNILLSFFGRTLDELKKLDIEAIVHFAGSTSFKVEDAENTKKINIDGTKNVIEIAKQLNVPIYYISTLYVGGSLNVLEENFIYNVSARNPYESSKLIGEFLVKNSGVKYSILRLPIVVGDSDIGQTLTYTGYYGFFIVFWMLKNVLKKKSLKKTEIYKKAGIYFDNNNFLHLPVRIECARGGTLNLMPVNYLVKVLMVLIGLKAEDKIFNIANTHSPSSEWIIKQSLEILGIDGVEIVSKEFSQDVKKDDMGPSSILGRLQKSVNATLELYKPYIMHEPRFSISNVRNLFHDYAPPLINSERIKILLEYAMRHNFKCEKV